jgi:TPR repeat protein
MHDGNIRADLLEAARVLNATSPDQLSIAALCKQTGTSRSDVRRHFSTNAALKAAVTKKTPVKKVPAAENPRRKPKTRKIEVRQAEVRQAEEIFLEQPMAAILEDAKPEVLAPDIQLDAAPPREDWLDHRLSVFERALALLETRAEDAALEQAQSFSSLEEKLSNLGVAQPAAVEPPPFVDAPATRTGARDGVRDSEIKDAAEAVFCYPPPALPVISDVEWDEKLPAFDARKKMRVILENTNLPNPETEVAAPREYKRAMTWALVSAAVAFAVLLLSLGLFSSGDPAGAKQIPVAKIEKPASEVSKVLVIDATGMAANTNDKIDGQTTSMAARSMVARAEGGDAHAQTDAALAFLRGDGVDADPMAAARWSQAAADQGDPNAQFILGSLYAQGVKPDPQRAVRWFTTAALRGNAKAMHNLAMAYLNGQGVAKDSAAAINWLVKAANGGYRDSAFDLAVLYERGEGVARSPQDALKWYDTATALGDSQAAARAKFLRTQLSLVATRR